VGMPECQLNLAQAAVYLALAPKSNASYKGLRAAQAWIRENGAPEIPSHLQDAHYPGAKKLGRGKGYDYPHGRPDGVSEQRVMPDEAADERFLELTDRGDEAALKERLEEIRSKRTK
jgi:putative ATPase